MAKETGASDVLYYPFSRCINVSALKQMVLIFETINFCDPVDDDDWRTVLFHQIEKEDGKFRRHRDISKALSLLLSAGVVRRIDPAESRRLQDDRISEAILADIGDRAWAELASDPAKHGLPAQRDHATGKPKWNVFRPKIPDKFVIELANDASLREHLIYDGGPNVAWELSYPAGSALGINTHLAIADEYDLAPVTDSTLHHQLMLMKLLRREKSSKSGETPSHLVVDLLAREAALAILQQWIPRSVLDRISFEQILEFREQSNLMRQAFFSDIRSEIDRRIAGATPTKIKQAVDTVSHAIVGKARKYEDDLKGITDKLWPNLVGALGSKTSLAAYGIGVAGTSTSLAAYGAIDASVILSPAHVLLASLPALIQPAKVLLEWNANRRKIRRAAPPAVAYLSSVGREL